jgi:hypothetical protein
VKHRQRIFENRMLRELFGAKRDEVTKEWRRFHNEELHGLYSSGKIIRVTKSRRMRYAGHVSRMGERRGACRVSMRKLEGKRPLGRSRRIWMVNIRMNLQGIKWGA